MGPIRDTEVSLSRFEPSQDVICAKEEVAITMAEQCRGSRDSAG
jgi:hypothetical protein